MKYISSHDIIRYANLMDDMKACQNKKFMGIMIPDKVNYQHRLSYQGKRITQTALPDEIPTKQERALRLNELSLLNMVGYNTFDATAMKSIELLDYLGVFSHGGIVIGSHAYAAIGNNLGVSWHDGLSTDDIDISHSISVARHDNGIQMHQMLLKADFSAVPSLNHKHPPSTFRHPNKIKIDFLTPLVGASNLAPKILKGLGVHADRMRFLDYLIKDPQEAILLTKYGTIAYVPQSARFAIHKCIISQYRDSDIKRAKDLTQAENIMSVLVDKYSFLIGQAWNDLSVPWQKKALIGIHSFSDPELIDEIKIIIGE